MIFNVFNMHLKFLRGTIAWLGLAPAWRGQRTDTVHCRNSVDETEQSRDNTRAM